MSAVGEHRQLLADSAVRFCAREHELRRVRACRDRQSDFDRAVWGRAAELGWLGIVVPEADGGLGLGLGDLAQVLGPWGAACAPEPLVAGGVLAGRALVHSAGPARARLLEELVGGTRVVALAWADAAGEVQPLRRTVQPGGCVLDGEARFVVPADADGWLVCARATEDSDDATIYWIEAGRPGLRMERERRADGSSAAKLNFDRVHVADADVVACAGTGMAVLGRAIDEARIALALEMAGLMRRMLDLTLDYLRTRVQFGRAIGSFQALQHRAVDLYIACELAQDVASAAAQAADDGATGRELALWAARAKARAAQALACIAREAVQLHGAIGFTDEYVLGVCVNRALVQCAWLGSADAMTRRYAALAPAFVSELP